MNQCRLIINGFLWHSPEGSFTRSCKEFRLWNLNFWQFCHIQQGDYLSTGSCGSHPMVILQANAQDIYLWYGLKKYQFKTTAATPRIQWVNTRFRIWLKSVTNEIARFCICTQRHFRDIPGVYRSKCSSRWEVKYLTIKTIYKKKSG